MVKSSKLIFWHAAYMSHRLPVAPVSTALPHTMHRYRWEWPDLDSSMTVWSCNRWNIFDDRFSSCCCLASCSIGNLQY
jgi:hypothetical protein